MFSRLSNAASGVINQAFGRELESSYLGDRIQQCEQRRTIKVPFNTGAALVNTAGGVFSVKNPEVGAVIIQDITIDVTNADTGGNATFDVSSSVATATTAQDPGLMLTAVAATVGVKNSVINKGTNGGQTCKWAAGEFINGSTKAGSIAGAIGNVYITYSVA